MAVAIPVNRSHANSCDGRACKRMEVRHLVAGRSVECSYRGIRSAGALANDDVGPSVAIQVAGADEHTTGVRRRKTVEAVERGSEVGAVEHLDVRAAVRAGAG